MNERFWIMLVDEPEDGRWAGWWGVVDENEGGIVALFPDIDEANDVLTFYKGKANS